MKTEIAFGSLIVTSHGITCNDIVVCVFGCFCFGSCSINGLPKLFRKVFIPGDYYYTISVISTTVLNAFAETHVSLAAAIKRSNFGTFELTN